MSLLTAIERPEAQFVGLMSTNSGASYYRARYYDPISGRFLNEDPIAYAGGDNFYPYVDNDPVNFADPRGLCPSPAPKTCGAKLPPDTRKTTMVNTLMGEMTGENMVGQNQYADDESGPISAIGPPGGAEITDDTLDLEAGLMAGTMLNLGHVGNPGTYKGLPQGRVNTAKAVKSAPGSPLCIMLQRAINAVNSPIDSNLKGWKQVAQGNGNAKFVRSLGNGVRVAGTDFQY